MFMKKIKILFFHFDLGNGGAEKVLINLLNNLNPQKYDITLRTIFSGDNISLLSSNIKFKPLFNRKAFRGTSRLFRLISPSLLYRILIKETYEIEIAYLEQIPTRILGGKRNKHGKKFGWVHNATDTKDDMYKGVFRTISEFNSIYSNYDKIAFVSSIALNSFEKFYNIPVEKGVVHNVCEFDLIKEQAKEKVDLTLDKTKINLCSVGRLCGQKGYDRLLSVLGDLKNEGFDNWELYIIGNGPERDSLEGQALKAGILEKIHFLGYQKNPFKYISKMDMFVCSSLKEGYSTAVTEAVVLGLPVLTTACAGMDEILDNGEVGIIVENTIEALKEGLRNVLNHNIDLKSLNIKSRLKGNLFSKENCIKEFENFIGTSEI